MSGPHDGRSWTHGARPPAWARRLVDRGSRSDASRHGTPCAVWRGPRHTLVAVRVPDAVELTAPELEQAVHAAYRRIVEQLPRGGADRPIRFWNFIPHIGAPMGDGDRYMAFNAGRYRAFVDWYGDVDAFGASVATASGVGHRGRDVGIWCLASRRSGASVENPRQVPAYRYSQRYGPLPPSFARATRVECVGGDGPSILVGGTASVLGEASAHVDDLEAQCRETLANLAALVRAACGGAGPAAESAWLARFRELRVYHVHASDRTAIAAHLDGRFPGVPAIEWVIADLCRPELLVEIEGVACGAPAPVGRSDGAAADPLATAR